MISKLSDRQRDIVIGTVLGGSSLVKVQKGINYYLSMRSSNLEWLQYKANELAGCFGERVFQYNKTYRYISCCSIVFTDLYHLLYKDNKRYITDDILSLLKDIGLAIWFLEGGGTTGRNKKNAYLNVTKLSNYKVVTDYFNSLDMTCKLHGNRIVFSINGTGNLMKVIAHQIPVFLHNRIPFSDNNQTS
jgi:hypothetical protein